MSLERRAPWDQAEPQSIIDHRETSRSKVKALPVGARNGLALAWRMLREASALSDARYRRLELAPPQAVEQVTHENDPLTLAPGEPLPGQVLDPRVHRIVDLAAETTRTQGCRFTGNELAVKPGGAASMYLRLDWEVGTHRERDALAASRILKRRSSTMPPGAASLAASRSAKRTW